MTPLQPRDCLPRREGDNANVAYGQLVVGLRRPNHSLPSPSLYAQAWAAEFSRGT
jgi:hypothetical protein